MEHCWLKRKGDCFDIYIKQGSTWKYTGKIKDQLALNNYCQKDSCLIEQDGIVDQILCVWDAPLLSAYLYQ